MSALEILTTRSGRARLRAGNVHLNGAPLDINSPFGGYKQSGNGREFSEWGLEEFLEKKAVLGFVPVEEAPAESKTLF